MSEEVAQSTPTESAGGETTTEATQSEAPSWSYAEGVAGNGDKPEWLKDKYKTVEAQARSYAELESKLGGFTGKPEQYTLGEGVEVDANDPLFKGLGEIGAKYNMNNDMYQEIVGMYNNYQQEGAQAYREQQLAELGDEANTRIKNIQDWVGANVPEAYRDNFLNWSQSAKDIEAIETLIGMTKGQKMASEATPTAPAFTEEGLAELQFATNDRGQRLMSVDPAHARKVRAYIAELNKLQN